MSSSRPLCISCQPSRHSVHSGIRKTNIKFCIFVFLYFVFPASQTGATVYTVESELEDDEEDEAAEPPQCTQWNQKDKHQIRNLLF